MDLDDKIAFEMSRMGITHGDAHIGVALSGGADSVALFMSLRRYCKVTALHCDFSLRGAESDGDREYCINLARKCNVGIQVVKFDTIREQLPGESIEMTCRRLRYGWFEQKAAELSLDFIALGHHLEDSIETMLLNLTRGTGPKGLSGIAPIRGIYIRPMLNFTRSEIEEYLRKMEIPYRTDSSNLTNDYRRNALRNAILPQLYDLIPTAQAGMQRTAEAMGHSSNMLSTYLKWCRERYFSGGCLDLNAMRQDDIDMDGTLFTLIPQLFGCNPGMDVISQITSIWGNGSSRLFPAGNGMTLERHQGKLMLYTEPDETEYEFDPGNAHFIEITEGIYPLKIEIAAVSHAEFTSAKKDNGTLWLDGSILDTPRRYTLRHWREGDRMHPFGAPGSRLLSDIFSDLKMSRSAKNRAWVLTVDSTPVWIAGIRASNLYKVTANSKIIIKLQVSTI